MDIKNKMLVEQIRSAVIGAKEQKDTYWRLVQEYNMVPLAAMYENKNYEGWFDEKGEVYSNIIKNEIYLLAGKSADSLYLLGDRLNYMSEHRIYAKLGFDSMKQYFMSDMFPYQKTTGYDAMAIHYYFSRDDGVALKEKARMLLPALNYMEKHGDLKKRDIKALAAKAMSLTEDQTKQFVSDLVNDMKQGTTRDLGDYKYDDQGADRESVSVNFIMPDFKTEGKVLKLQFKNKVSNEVYSLALRRLSNRIENEIEKILSEPEFETYRNKLK